MTAIKGTLTISGLRLKEGERALMERTILNYALDAVVKYLSQAYRAVYLKREWTLENVLHYALTLTIKYIFTHNKR